MILGNPRYNQMFLLFSTLITMISLFLYYSIKDLSNIKQELKNISAKLDKKPATVENICAFKPMQIKDKKVVKENHDETKNIVKEIVDHIDDDDDEDDNGSIKTEDLEKHLS
jgi:membrane-associated HD superfamily phosphohydrolase